MKKCMLAAIVLLQFLLVNAAQAAEHYEIRGLRLGDGYAQMVAKLGKPRTDMDRLVGEKLLRYYIYKDFRIGMDFETDKIADMRVLGKNYRAANGVALGATPHKVLKEYGKNERRLLDNRICYLYINEEFTAEKIIFDITEGYVEEIRVTDLPVAVQE